MERVRTTLSITLTVTCPECGHFFDLVSDTQLNDEGWLLDQVLPDQTWTEAHENFECGVICPKCSVELKTRGVDW